MSGETPLSQMMLDTAISTSIFAVVNREDTPLAAAGEAFRNYFRGVEPGYNARLIQKIRAVTPEACIKVGHRSLSARGVDSLAGTNA